MNRLLNTFTTRIKTNKVIIWIFLMLMTLLTIVGPVLAEGATGSSV